MLKECFGIQLSMIVVKLYGFSKTKKSVKQEEKQFCGKMSLLKGAITKFVAFLRKWKHHQISIVF